MPVGSENPEEYMIKGLLEQGGYTEEVIREILRWYGYREG
jgi:hypothetical protein